MSHFLYSEQDAAQAPSLVLLHGWGANLRVFDPLRTALAGSFAVTAIDLPGHGRSGWSANESSTQQFARIAELVPTSAILLGWSLGGQLAMQLSQHAGLFVRALVLIGTTPRFVESEDWPYGVTLQTLRQFGADLARDADKTVAEFLELQVRGSSAASSVLHTLQQAVRQHGAAQPSALAAGLAMLEHNDLRSLARQLRLPSLVISGQYDRVTPPQASSALAQLLPQAQLLSVPRAGHAPFLSHTAEIGAALRAFTPA